jgi:uncharacterized protein (DUF779 family)
MGFEHDAVPERVMSTEAAARLVRQLRDQYGPVLLHQSGGMLRGQCADVPAQRLPRRRATCCSA